MEDGEGKKKDCPLLLVYECEFLTRQASPPFATFVRFDWISRLMKDGNAPKISLNPSINSQQLSSLLICNLCCAPVGKKKKKKNLPGMRETCSSLPHGNK